MEKKLLEEINRFREIAGLELINEQNAWLEELIKKGTPRIANMDQIIKNLGFTGKQLTNEEIDEIFDAIGKNTDIPEQILSKLKEEIKSNLNLKNALTNIESNFVKELKNSRKATKAAFQRINAPINVTEIIKGSVKKLLDLPTSKLSIYFENQTKNIIQTLETLSTKGKKIKSEEDIWNIIDSLVNDSLVKKAFDDVDLSDITFQELKQKFRNQPDIKEAINKLKSENKLSTGTSTVPAVPKFTKTTLADKYLTTKGWLDDASETLPKVKDNVPVKVDDGSKLPTTLDEANEVLARYEETPTNPNPPDPAPNNTPDPVFFNNFFYKYCKTGLCEAVLNLLSALVMTPQKLAEDTIFTQQRIIDLSQQLERMNPGDKNLFKVKFELDGWVNRLKRNINLAKDAENGFLTTWETMKAQIRATAGAETGNRVIQYCETKAITSQGETLTKANPIKNFTDLLFEHTDKWGGSTDFYDIRKVLTPEFWATLKNTSAGRKYDEYAALVKSADEKLTKTGFIGVFYKIAKDSINELFKRTINILTFGTFRNYKNIISSLTKGKFTSRTPITIFGRTFYGAPALQRWSLLYVEMMLISNIVMPFLEFAKETLFGLYEIFVLGDIKNESGLTPWEQFKKDIVDRIPIIGEEFDWNPFLNPIGFIPGVKEVGQTLGFEPAPLPKFIAEKIGRMLGIVGDAADNDRSINIAEENRKKNEEEFLRILNDILNAREKRKIEEYNNNPAKQKETQNETEKMKENFVRYNTFESLKTSHPEHYIEDLNLISKLQNSLVYFNELRPSVKRAILIQEVLKPKNVLKDNKVVGTFNPNQKIKFVPNQTGIDLGYKTDNEPPIGTEIQELDIKKFNPNTIDSDFGYWALKGKDNKYYEVSKDDWGNGTFYSFKTPDVKTMLENLNVETKLHPLKDFANYL